MDCLHSPVGPSRTMLDIEQYEKGIIRKIQMLVTPKLFPDFSGATHLIEDPFGEAINLAKELTTERKENALVYITGHFPATSSDRAYQTIDLIETKEKRDKAIVKIQVTEFRALLKQKEFMQAKLKLAKLPIEKLYYHWLYVVEVLECVQFDKVLGCIKNVDLLEGIFDFLKNIPESFHEFPYMSEMLEAIFCKFLTVGNLEKALVTARMLKHNDTNLRKIGSAYLKLNKFECAYAILNEIKCSFELQWLKQDLCHAHLKRGEITIGLQLVKEIDDELIWNSMRRTLESFIEKYKNKGQEIIGNEIQQALDTQEKIF